MTANRDTDGNDVKGREQRFESVVVCKPEGTATLTPQPEPDAVEVRVRPAKNAVGLELAGEVATIEVQLLPQDCAGLSAELLYAASQTEREHVETSREMREDSEYRGFNEMFHDPRHVQRTGTAPRDETTED
jgi:hypothetical protein